ncbi:MAG: LTA synthase family protein [Salinivirgaceae bacterium]|nr:LTA synthase family protein [Salinivirgaceae bacterium]MDD4747295.1 LTA synthase family protein [Salinivirgaceae bacterium]
MNWIRSLSANSLMPELWGFISDFAALSKFGVVLLFIGFLFFWNKCVKNIFIQVLSVVYIFISVASVYFFLTALVLLDHSVFTYSLSDIFETLISSQFAFLTYVFFAIPFVFYFMFYWLGSKIKFLPQISLVILLLGIVAHLVVIRFQNDQYDLIQQNLRTSKVDYFITKGMAYFSKSTESGSDNEDIQKKEFLKHRQADGFYSKATGMQIANIPYADVPEMFMYPLLHKNNYSPLDNYFQPFPKTPNIVLIVVESLNGRLFNPKEGFLKHMPFLDSLKNNSLYWSNCYSTSERTFGVLPSILGSLPYGERGFSELNPLPEHLSVTQILSQNGYFSSFFYGGWIYFQGMGNLLKYQKIDYLSESFPSHYKPMDKDSSGFAWGYPDGEVYKRSFEVLDSVKRDPFFNIYMTVSTHHPFSIPNRDKYWKKMQSLANKNPKSLITKAIMANPEPYIAFAYADDCLRYLFSGYKKRNLYENTIFIITGDHHAHEIGSKNMLEMFHVPLIVYSPKLKNPGHFDAVVSHLDIAPTLINFLRNQQHITSSEIVHWMGYGLETNNKANKKFIPLMRNNKEIDLCVYGQYFYNQGHLFTFTNGQNIVRTTDDDVHRMISGRLKSFAMTNKYVTQNQFIVSPRIIYANSEFNTLLQYPEDQRSNIPGLLNKSDKVQYQDLTLDNTYLSLTFDFDIRMKYSDTLPNPDIGIRIYDTNNQYLNYYYFKNEKYTTSKGKVGEWHNYHIVRRIPNENHLFQMGNRFEFFIDNVGKEIEIERFNLIVIGEKIKKSDH